MPRGPWWVVIYEQLLRAGAGRVEQALVADARTAAGLGQWMVVNRQRKRFAGPNGHRRVTAPVCAAADDARA
jgi:hypothetical protein